MRADSSHNCRRTVYIQRGSALGGSQRADYAFVFARYCWVACKDGQSSFYADVLWPSADVVGHT